MSKARLPSGLVETFGVHSDYAIRVCLDARWFAMDTLAKLLLTWFGNPVRALATALLSSAILLCLKGWKPVTDIIHDEFWRWPLLIFVVSTAGLSTYAIEVGFKSLRSLSAGISARRALIDALRNLTLEEKHALQPSFDNGQRTILHPARNRVMASLVNHGIIVPRETNESLTVFHYSDEAWKYLTEHREALATPDNPRKEPTGNEYMNEM